MDTMRLKAPSQRLLLAVTIFAIASLSIYQHSFTALSNHNPTLDTRSTPSFQWDKISPTPQLIYHPCFDTYQCARLALPMDWNSPYKNGAASIALAVIRLPAKVPITDERYGGPVILNPGGPSNSGIKQVLTDGRRIQKIIDSEATPSKFFDIVSFDPRGINNTTPPFACFSNSTARRHWMAQMAAEGMLGSSDTAFDTLWARSAALGTTCSSQGGAADADWIGRHMNTPPVVGDMVELIERYGEWREGETERILLQGRGLPHSGSDGIRQRNAWKKGHEKLLYWGISYGSILGMTFAAMHPDRVRRVVVDGVVDADDYYGGYWLKNIQDADAAFDKFFEYCHEAGPKRCALATTGESAGEIKTRVEALIQDLKMNPVAVPASESRPPDIITYSDVKAAITTVLYQPMQLFGLMAQGLADLSHNNGSAFADSKAQGAVEICPADPSAVIPGENKYEAQGSIICTDGLNIDGITKDTWRRYWKTLQRQSRTLGDEWSQTRLPCIKWKTQPAWRFDGPIAGNTSHPLLFIGNTYDLVTPLRNAVQMARRFPRSVVLQQNSVGVCDPSPGATALTASSIARTAPLRRARIEPSVGIFRPASSLDRGLFVKWTSGRLDFQGNTVVVRHPVQPLHLE